LNTAQKVRIWLMVGFSAIMGVCICGAASSVTNPLYTDPSSGLGVYDVHAGELWIGWAVIMFVTNAVLAGFTIYRMYKPLPPGHQSRSVTINKDGVSWGGTMTSAPSNPAGEQAVAPAPRQGDHDSF
jgi:hypothetical protein